MAQLYAESKYYLLLLTHVQAELTISVCKTITFEVPATIVCFIIKLQAVTLIRFLFDWPSGSQSPRWKPLA